MSRWTKRDLHTFLGEQPRIGRLATVTPGGDPHVVPVWFRLEGGRILVHTMGTMQKTRNLRNHPRFALSVDSDQWPYKGVTVRGSARIAGRDEFPHEAFVEQVSVSYLGEETGRALGRYMAGMPGEHVMVVLEPETWHGFDYSSS